MRAETKTKSYFVEGYRNATKCGVDAEVILTFAPSLN